MHPCFRRLVPFVFPWFCLSQLHAAISIDTVPVGATAGNVAYDYRIGTYEVTNAQYVAFLNAVAADDPHGLYNPYMEDPEIVAAGGGIARVGSAGSYQYAVTAGAGNYPVRLVSFYDAARFCNWVTNGQPVGPSNLSTTESGMYYLGGVSQPQNNQIVRLLKFQNGQNGVALPSSSEWYKAGHYDPARGTSFDNYWKFATQSDQNPLATGPNATHANSANYNNAVGGATPVGGYELAASYFGTYDQSGNVWEIFDSLWNTGDGSHLRREGGGSWANGATPISKNYATSSFPHDEFIDMGFRIVTLDPIPEPGPVGYVSAFACLVALWRKRRPLP